MILTENDTIVALASGNGANAISIIRLSGQKALEIARKITKKENFTPRFVHLCEIYDDNDIIDIAIVIYFQSPKSFTGEDIIEFQCHGGVGVSSFLIDVILKNGARLAKPGEFSKRAVLNGKMDLTQAEAIAKLIESKSKQSVKTLAKHLKGELQKFIENIREALIEILAYIEVSIDYAEEDLPKDLELQIEKKIENVKNELFLTLKRSEQNEALINGFKIAIVGKPNVGKSSLLNSLLSYDRAIVSDLAGTTRDTIEEEIKIANHIVRIIDTAGIRASNDDIEQIGIQRSKNAIFQADIIIAMFDNSRVKDNEDEEILELLKKEDKQVFYVLNKIDKEAKFDYTLENPIMLSCKDSSLALIEVLEDFLKNKNLDDGIIVSTKRQMLCLKDAYNSVNSSYELLKDFQIELFAFEINEAIKALSAITKPLETDEILDLMFSKFCLGK